MKYNLKLFFINIITILFISSCSSDDNNEANQVANATSQICPEIIGPTAIYWDVLNGFPATQLTQIPTIQNLGGFFAHSTFPGLGFSFPVGYSANEINPGQSNLVGVNVTRDDNRAIWRNILGLSLSGNFMASDLIESEINDLLGFLGVPNTNFTVICSEDTFDPNNGIGQLSFSSRLIQFDEFTSEIALRVQFSPAINMSFLSLFTSASPTVEFDASVLDVFLPIYFQLLVVDEDVRDSDLDGTPDNQDNFPFDPTRQ